MSVKFPYDKKVSHDNRTTVARQLATKQFYWKHCVVRQKNMLRCRTTRVVWIEQILFLRQSCDTIVRFLVFGNKLMIPSRQLDGKHWLLWKHYNVNKQCNDILDNIIIVNIIIIMKSHDRLFKINGNGVCVNILYDNLSWNSRTTFFYMETKLKT